VQCWLYFSEDNCPFYRATVFSNYSPHHVPLPGWTVARSSAFSANFVRSGKQWSLMCEVSESSMKPGARVWLVVQHCAFAHSCIVATVDQKEIVAQAEKGLLATKLISPEHKVLHIFPHTYPWLAWKRGFPAQILSRFHIRLEYGYPTPFLGRDQLCNPIHEALRKRSILRSEFGVLFSTFVLRCISILVFSRGRFGAWKYEVSNQDHSMMQGVEAADQFVFGQIFDFSSALGTGCLIVNFLVQVRKRAPSSTRKLSTLDRTDPVCLVFRSTRTWLWFAFVAGRTPFIPAKTQ
jgi:hypothetical protein